MTKKDNTKSFEDAYNQLKEVVEKLESSETNLEESLKFFEQGMDLVQYCNKKLEEAENKLQKLVKDDDNNVQVENLNK